MPRDIIVIGGSAGAIEPLTHLFSFLPRRLKASIFVVVHTSSNGRGGLPEILANASMLPVSFAKDGQTFRPFAFDHPDDPR